MNKKQRNLQLYIFSTVGVLIMAALLIAVNVIFSSANARIDCTEENLHTLSDGTKAILKDMDTKVQIRFYYSRGIPQTPVSIKNYAGRIEDLLKEYKRYGGGKVQITKLDPKPDTDAEDSAQLDGVDAKPIGIGENLYCGIAVNCLDKTETLPFLTPDRESMLEYDITRAIYRVLHPEKLKVGILSSLPVMGQSNPNPMMAMQGGGGNVPPWYFVTKLKEDYDVVEVPKDAESLDEDLDMLLLVHPKELKDGMLFSIDQYLLKGGRVLAFMDPMCQAEQMTQKNPQMRYMPPGASDLGALLGAWGVEFDSEKIIVDRKHMLRIPGQPGAAERAFPGILNLPKSAVNADDPAVGMLDVLWFVNGAPFQGTPPKGVEKTELLHTSNDTQMIQKFMAQGSSERILQGFVSDDMSRSLGIRLTGTFKTAFPNGDPAVEAEEDEDGKDEKKEASGLKQSTKPGVVILIGDADMLFDQFVMQQQRSMFGPITQFMNENITLVQNLVEQLAGDSNLISIRSRGALQRPFEKVREMQAKANDKFQAQIKELEKEADEIREKINNLQRNKTKEQKRFLSEEQVEEIQKLRKSQNAANKRLKEVRKEFRKEIDSLENRLMVVNIALMPLLIAIGGILLALYKHRKMVRK